MKEQSSANRKKLLEDLHEEEKLKDEEMKRIQAEKDMKRSALFDKINNAEKQTDVLINELMANSTRYSDPKKVMMIGPKEAMADW